MSTGKWLPLLVLAAAVAAFAGTIAWAVAKATEDEGYRSQGPVMMQSAMGQTMMGYAPGDRRRVTGPPEAKRLTQRFADRLGLEADEVLRFERNYYVKLVDRQDRGATEVLVDPGTGFVSLEYGPAMMWNTRYGMMDGGMMGSYGRTMGGMMGSGSGMMGGGMMGSGSPGAQDSSSPRISPDQAERAAERWLRANGLDVQVAEAEAFPGYYTLETLRGGRVDGMLSVHAATGAVIYHWWHGRFVEMVE